MCGGGGWGWGGVGFTLTNQLNRFTVVYLHRYLWFRHPKRFYGNIQLLQTFGKIRITESLLGFNQISFILNKTFHFGKYQNFDRILLLSQLERE